MKNIDFLNEINKKKNLWFFLYKWKVTSKLLLIKN